MLDTDAESADARARSAQRMCEQLLANPVTEDFDIATVEPA
jgi:phosphoribosylformylglycinamidine (FGAM) synthase PurS component